MLPIHAFLADVSCPPGVSADDRFAEVGGLFIGWVEGAFTDESPGFVLPDGGTVEPAPGHVIGVQSDCLAPAHERYRLTWQQPWLYPGSELVQEYAVARAGDRLSASVVWRLASDGPLPAEFAEPIRPDILDRLLPFTLEPLADARHPLDGLARRDCGGAFWRVEAVLDDRRTEREQERAAFCAEVEKENRELAAEREELRVELDDLHETVFEQRSQLMALGGKRRRGTQATGEEWVPETVVDAAERAKAEFPQELLFLKSADESAADSPYQNPQRVYALLHALGDIARRWRTNALNMEWFEAFQKADPQFVYKPHLSQTTASNNWEDYAFLYDGVRRLFEPHVSLGKSFDPKKCLSVHWYRDEDAKKVVVGWCGRHRPNTKT